MRVLVTGADGMLGSNLVRELLDQNHKVTAFLLPGSKAPTLQGLDIDIHYGNILDLPSLNRAASQCDAIIHTAAITNIWPNRSDIVKKVNIEGTRNVIAAALAAKVQRMVYVGTANSFGFGSKKQPGNETKPYRADTYGLDYMDSKYQAQKLVLQAVKQKALPAVIINPTFMWGPFDAKPGAASMILAIYHGKVPAATTGGRNYVYVKDVTAAIVEALHSGKIGHCYIAGNENLSYEEAFAKIAKVIGVNPP
ncbi:MAG TPA: NAD-dependent epimerase/dehydratase family protein, partial [Phaeodactylibacter sp.]|nr:NAD-dependent epimerase/dehydratase family protein [Phaeodactylibacter sp.]